MPFNTNLDGEIINGYVEIPFVRDPFNYDRNLASTLSGIDCQAQIDKDGEGLGKSRTKQEFAKDSDINEIVRKFGLTGELPENLRVPQPLEFEEVFDFQSAMNVVRAAEESFMEMPADIRNKFDNDPGKFLNFVNDDKNYVVAKEWGIVAPKPAPKEPEPMLVKIIGEKVTEGGTAPIVKPVT